MRAIKTTIMNFLNIDDLLPLIPAFCILLVLILVYAIYKLQAHLKNEKKLDQIEKDLGKSDSAKHSTNHLVVPSINKVRGAGLKNETGDMLDDDPRNKPLFPAEAVSAPLIQDDKSCDALYEELLDSDRAEEALYQDLLGITDSKEKTQSSQLTTGPANSKNTELASETLLSEIENELLMLEKELNSEPATGSTETSINNNNDWQNDYYSENNLTPSGLDSLFDSNNPNSVPASQLEKEMDDSSLSQEVEKPECIVARDDQDAKLISNEPKNIPPVGLQQISITIPPARTPVQEKADQYIDRLKLFQNNLERRFGSFDEQSTKKKKISFDRGSEGNRVQPSINKQKDEKQISIERNYLELLESFLFTAGQRRAKQ